MASTAGSVASIANKQRGGGLQLLANITNTSASAKGMHFPGRREDQGVNQTQGSQRGVFWKDFSSRVSSCNQVPTTCPQGEPQTHPTLTPKWTGEITSNCEKSPHILQEGMHTLQAHIYWKEHKFVTQKGSSTSDVRCMHFLWLGGYLSPAKRLELILASMIRLYVSRQKEIYVDFFGFLTSLEDVTDDIKS